MYEKHEAGKKGLNKNTPVKASLFVQQWIWALILRR
jgi:hypothetical protein